MPATPHHACGDHHQFGRRVEADGSWTVYHVFSGAPAALRDAPTAQLTRGAATRLMQKLNAAPCPAGH